jgi:hypothetical protein
MALRYMRNRFRRLSVLLACLLVLQALAGVAQASLRLAERADLKMLGLLDAVICHGDPAGKSQGADQGADKKPGHAPAHAMQCDCCLTGCGAAGPAGLPTEHGAIVRPLLAANATALIALDSAGLRSFVNERTRNPRSPPFAV